MYNQWCIIGYSQVLGEYVVPKVGYSPSTLIFYIEKKNQNFSLRRKLYRTCIGNVLKNFVNILFFEAFLRPEISNMLKNDCLSVHHIRYLFR